MESKAKRKLLMESTEATSRKTTTKSGRTTAANAGGKRKPLADCTNTIASLTSSQSSSSSIIKPPKSSAPPKSQLKQTNTNAQTTADSHQNNMGSPTPSSTFPSLPQSTSVSGSATSESSASVYTRRKGKGKEIAEPEPLDFSQVTRIPDLRDKKNDDGNIGLSKSSAVTVPGKKMNKMNEDGNGGPSKSITVPVPRKKKQCRHALPKEFIETQKAYFDEIDKFELPVEEVASVDELE